MKKTLVIISAVICGCHSFTLGSMALVAPQARVPISMTTGLVDDKGIVDLRRVHRVGDFQMETECTTGQTIDMSTAINDQVARAGGDAIVNLEFSAGREKDCVAAKVTGAIVKVDP